MVVANLLLVLSGLRWFVFVFYCFLFLCFRSDRKTLFETSGGGELFWFMLSTGVWLNFHLLSIFWSQIYTFLSTSERHAPLNRDNCCPLVLPPKATVVWFTSDQRMVITSLRVFFSDCARWRSRIMESDLLQGDSGDGTCSTHAVFQRRQPMPPTWVGFFCFAMFVYSPYFFGHSLSVYYSILLEYLLASI
jgi:hypothetical protein